MNARNLYRAFGASGYLAFENAGGRASSVRATYLRCGQGCPSKESSVNADFGDDGAADIEFDGTATAKIKYSTNGESVSVDLGCTP